MFRRALKSRGAERTVALVQARMGSSRFPGKMMAHLGGRPLLSWVLERMLRSTLVDEVVLATSDHVRDDPLAGLAGDLGVAVYRGVEDDVLGRLAQAAKVHRADTVIRVCADNPFICPGEVDRLVGFWRETDCDYACNHLDRFGSRYADGFGAEVLGADLLHHMDVVASLPVQREHVTRYLWDHPERFVMSSPAAPKGLAYPDLKFDVDLPDQLAELEVLRQTTNLQIRSTAGQVVLAALAQRLTSPIGGVGSSGAS